MKRTFIVGVDGSSNSTLINACPRSWFSERGDRFIAVQNGDVVVDNGQVSGYYDLHLRSYHGVPYLQPGNNIIRNHLGLNVLSTRQAKSDQAAALNAFFAKGDSGKYFEFYPLNTWNDHKCYTGKNNLVVIKPENGARGIGQITLNLHETSIEALLIKRAEIAPQLQKIDDIQETNKLIKEAFGALAGTPVWESSGDRFVREGFEKTSCDLVFQEYVPNIQQELRVIFGGDNTIAYVIERERKVFGQLCGVELAAATGCRVGMQHAKTEQPDRFLPANVRDGFKALAQEFDFSLCSFDVFLTRDNKWGIFEFSNEFGTSSVPNSFASMETRKFVERICYKDIPA